MTATTFVPTGDPVRRFVLAIVLVAALCLGLWWSALLAPRLVLFVEEWNVVTHQAVLHVTNDGPTSVEVEGVGIDPGASARIPTALPAHCDAPIVIRASTVAGVTRTIETDGPVTCRR